MKHKIELTTLEALELVQILDSRSTIIIDVTELDRLRRLITSQLHKDFDDVEYNLQMGGYDYE